MIGPPPASGHAKLRIQRLPPGTVWYRIVHRRHPSALHFGTGPDARWNDPRSLFGVLYVADSVEAAFAETFGHEVPSRYPPLVDKFVDTLELEERVLHRIESTREIVLGLFQGAGLAALNLDAEIIATSDYTLPQHWSRWVYDAPKGLDGICYPSRLLPNRENSALFDRCRSGLKEQPVEQVLHWQCPDTRRDIFDILDNQGWGLL